MTSAWTIIGYFLIPIGLLLILMIEPASIFTFRWKKGLVTDTAVIVVSVWWASLVMAPGPNSTLPGLYNLLMAAAYVGLTINACVMAYRQIGKQPQQFQEAPRKRRMLAAGVLLLLLGSLNTFGHVADRYIAARRLSAEIDTAPVYLSPARP